MDVADAGLAVFDLKSTTRPNHNQSLPDSGRSSHRWRKGRQLTSVQPARPPTKMEVSRGTLYLVSTPIGNLEDISFRAVKVLSQVNLIAAEDTRTTTILLNHYNIKTRAISYFSQNEFKRIPYLIDRLEQGDSIAVVTESGTPGISDPACRMVRAALDRDVPVVVVPGPTAFLSAFIVSGFPEDAFVFEGFLPHKKGRTKLLDRLKGEANPIILYESPHRILRTLKDLLNHLGDRRIVVARELTKKFEEVLRGSISEVCRILSVRRIRGEFVVVVAGNTKAVAPVNKKNT